MSKLRWKAGDAAGRSFRTLALASAILAIACPVHAQRPSIPPQTIRAPALAYTALEPDAGVAWPGDIERGQVASVDIDSNGHVIVLHRGNYGLLEFDAAGHFVRAFAEGLFERAHSLTVTADGDYWVTDVSAQTVMKLDREGHVLLTLGTRGESGEWNETTGTHRFDQPTDVAIAPDGSIFVSQGHSVGEPKILKFDSSGRYLKSWGGRGSLPWQFQVAHSIVIKDGLLYVGDRENRRIEIFDLDGNFVKGWVYQGMACSLFAAADGYLYMTTGFDGQIVKIDMNGKVLGAVGRPGEGAGEYGEAHDLVVSRSGEIYIADVVNLRLQKLVPR